MKILDSIQQIELEVQSNLKNANSVKELEALKVKYLGKKGPIQSLMLSLKEASQEERPALGKAINELKVKVSELINEALEAFSQQELKKQLQQETIDVTLPGRKTRKGNRHILLKTLDHCLEILTSMGFVVQYGPDIETDYYNFEALNIPSTHPARDMQDTFYITPEILLRTHTSNTQVRVMMASNPPIRVAAPGKAYRSEDVSSRSHVVFHQVEGIYIDHLVSFSDLLKTLQQFFETLFKKDLKMRFRPSFFPFVEPGVEIDIHCLMCDQKGCSVCKQTGWLEVAGAGMIHPEVMKNGGIDPEIYFGYAFAFGIERITMLLHSIKDIRLFLENDERFLKQFS